MPSVSSSSSLLGRVVSICTVVALAACSGGGGGGSGGGIPDPGGGGVTATSHRIGGTISGLAGHGLRLRNNGADEIAPGAGDSAFQFPAALTTGAAYAVTVAAQPSNPMQTCAVTNAANRVGSADVSNVQVNCTTNTYTVGGTVTGHGPGLMLQNNGTDDLAVAADGNFLFATPIASGALYNVTVATAPAGKNCTVVHGSGSIAAAAVANVAVTCTNIVGPPPSHFSVGGSVAGLAGSGLLLRNNGGDDISPGNGAFAFATALSDGSAYSVVVAAQPTGPAQTCAVVNGTGTISGSNVTNVTVNCTTNTYTIGGTVAGLAGSGLVLQNNGGNSLAVAADGPFSFTASVTSNGSYLVTVAVQPSSPAQTCVVTHGTGTVTGANVTGVQVNCTTNTYTLGGTVTGLAGGGLVLRNNGGSDHAVAAAGGFVFAGAIASGNAYNVTVAAQPTTPTQTCVVADGSGTVGSNAVTSVQVSCTTNAYTVGGTVAGLAGGGLVLRNNGGDDLAVTADGSFVFGTGVASGAGYSVAVAAQPSNPAQTCAVSSAAGTIGAGNVANVAVSCTTNSYTIGGTVSGLSGTGLTLRNNGSDDVVVSANGAFTFSASIASGAGYVVTVAAQPRNLSQTCVVTSGSGTVGGVNVTGVQVQCQTNRYTVSGTVRYLNGSGLALQNNGGDNLAVLANGSFGFATSLEDGASYNVSVLTQPAAPAQTCSVGATGAGTIAGADVTGVLITCTPWTKQLGTAVYDGARHIATDGAGNVYVGAETDGSFDGNSSAGGADVTVIKYANDGTKVWSRQLGTAGNEFINGIAVDAAGHVYVAGRTTGAFGGYTNAGDNDVFLAKYDNDGALRWVQQLGTALYDAANGVAADAAGAVYLVGETDGALPGQTNAGDSDAFLAKYDGSGAPQWIQQFGTAAYDAARGVAADAAGNVSLVGETDAGLHGNISAGDSDAFVAKYTSSGNRLWTAQFGTAAYDAANGAATDAAGNVYVVGETDAALPGNTSAGSTDSFTAKYDASGTRLWLRQLGSDVYDAAADVAIDAGGDIYVAGETDGNLDGYSNAGMSDVFVLKYDATGAKQ